MKRILTIAASAAILMAGCTKTGPVSVGGDSGNGSDEILFTTYFGRAATKASGTDLTQSFNVEAINHLSRSKFFKGTDYRYSDGSFTSDTARFWPVSGNLDFYAVSPLKYANTSATDVTLAVSDSSFTVSKTDGKTDILGARKVNEAKSNPVAPVALAFNHKLTKVSFKAVGADPTVIYKIYSIVVTANSSSKYSFGPTEGWSTSSDAYDYVFLNTKKTIPVNTQTPIEVGESFCLIPNQTSVKAKVRYAIYEGSEQIDTTLTPIEVTLPTTSWGINKSIVYSLTLNFTSSAQPIVFNATPDEWVDNARNVAVVEGALSGVFTVGAGPDGKAGTADDVRVRFSKGNLQYLGTGDSGTKTPQWRFADNQYDIMGDGPSSGTTKQGNVTIAGYSTYNTGSGSAGGSETDADRKAARDLFGWGATGFKDTRANTYQTNYRPYSTCKADVAKSDPVYNINRSGYGPDYDTTNEYGLTVASKSDWGYCFGGDNSVWRTLSGGSTGEWKYLLMLRNDARAPEIGTQADARYAAVKVNGIVGLLVFPDVFTWPSDVTTKPTLFNINSKDWNNINYGLADFAKLESAGCVFLPGFGFRSGSDIGEINFSGSYWSSTASSSFYACYLGYNSSFVNPSLTEGKRRYGIAVRLVTVVQ